MKIYGLIFLLLTAFSRPVMPQDDRHHILNGTALGGMITKKIQVPWISFGYEYKTQSRLSAGLRISFGAVKQSADLSYFKDNYIEYKIISTQVNYFLIQNRYIEIISGLTAGYHAGGPLKYQITYSRLKSINNESIYDRIFPENIQKGYFFATPHAGLRLYAFRYFGFYGEASYIPYHFSGGIITRF